MTATDALDVRNNHDKHRFEVQIDGQLAMIEYMEREGMIIFTHAEVPPALEGQGIASRMAHVALEYAAAQQLKVLPLCPFVASYIRRHPQYQPLVINQHT